MSRKYKIQDQDKLYFITFTVVYWVNVFTKTRYKDILVESIKHCQQQKGLEVSAWCIMSNHVHMIVGRSGEQNIDDILRDFKKFTSTSICRAIESNQKERRKEWLLLLFARAAVESNKHVKYKFWIDGFHPIELSSNHLMDQKLDYIHNNPVVAGIVDCPEAYVYSSAIDYMTDRKGLIELRYIG